MSLVVGIGGVIAWGLAALFFAAGGTDIHLGFGALLVAAGFGLFGLASIVDSAGRVAKAVERGATPRDP